MLASRLRRQPNIKTTLNRRLVGFFAGLLSGGPTVSHSVTFDPGVTTPCTVTQVRWTRWHPSKPMLGKCWPRVEDDDPTFNQHWANVSRCWDAARVFVIWSAPHCIYYSKIQKLAAVTGDLKSKQLLYSWFSGEGYKSSSLLWRDSLN